MAACVELAPEPAPEVAIVESAEIGMGGEGVYDIEPQGKWLIGAQLDLPPFTPQGATAHFYVDRATKDGRPVQLVVVGQAGLTAAGRDGTDPWFDGVIVSNGVIELKLTAPAGTSKLTRYRLMRRSTGSAFDTDVCGPEGGEVIPLAGWFRTDGLHIADQGRITFACANAAAHKCSIWGYAATPAPGLSWDANQACTRMVRADYGANGESHTRMETAIKIADAIPGVNDLPGESMLGDVTTWPPDPEKFFFEAAWFPGMRRPWCLGKMRWSSIPPGGYPNMGLADPRVDPLAKACEDMTVDEIVRTGALTFVASSYNDLPLKTWRAETVAGDDYVTTVRGYHAELEAKLIRPFPEYHVYGYLNTVGFLLRKPPGSIENPATELVPVHMYRQVGSNRMVLAAWNDARFGNTYVRDPQREGYVLSWQREGTIAFRLYQHTGTLDYLSTVDFAVPQGYQFVANIGWIMAPEPGH